VVFNPRQIHYYSADETKESDVKEEKCFEGFVSKTWKMTAWNV